MGDLDRDGLVKRLLNPVWLAVNPEGSMTEPATAYWLRDMAAAASRISADGERLATLEREIVARDDDYEVAEARLATLRELAAAQAERIGQLADRLDAILYSAKLPLPPQTNLAAMAGVVREVRDELATVVREATGSDPWADNPMEG